MKKECCGEEVGHLWDCPTLKDRKKVVLDSETVLQARSFLQWSQESFETTIESGLWNHEEGVIEGLLVRVEKLKELQNKL